MLPVAILIALLMLSALITGAYGQTEASLSTAGLVTSDLHRHVGELSGAVAVALLAWIAVKILSTRKLAVGLLVGILLEGLLGHLPNGTAGWSGLLHAVLGQGLFAGSVALVVATMASWTNVPQLVPDYGWPSLRSLAITAPALVLIQIALGAAFRHMLLTLLPHIVGAMLVTIFTIMVGSFVLQQCKNHKILSGTARGLMVITFLQVFLGIAVYTVRILPKAEPSAILLIATAHVTIGGFLLAASVVMGMQIRRNVTPKNAS